MRIHVYLATAAVSAAALSGPCLHAGLFDRLRDRSDSAAETSSAASETDESTDAGKEQLLLAAAIERGDVGKILTPVAYQPTLAPSEEGALLPVPESSLPPAPAYDGSSAVYGGGPTPAFPVEGYPVPGIPIEGVPFAGPPGPIGPMMAGEGFPLFDRVKYEDRDHVHPCATPIVVQVLDPCSEKAQRGFLSRLHHRNDCDLCGPQFVCVEICVPPGCPDIDVSRSGTKVTYDYGDYKVEITSKKGVVYVDYDD